MACAKRAACETTRSKALRVVYEHLDLGRRLAEYKERLKRLQRLDVALNERNREALGEILSNTDVNLPFWKLDEIHRSNAETLIPVLCDLGYSVLECSLKEGTEPVFSVVANLNSVFWGPCPSKSGWRAPDGLRFTEFVRRIDKYQIHPPSSSVATAASQLSEPLTDFERLCCLRNIPRCADSTWLARYEAFHEMLSSEDRRTYFFYVLSWCTPDDDGEDEDEFNINSQDHEEISYADKIAVIPTLRWLGYRIRQWPPEGMDYIGVVMTVMTGALALKDPTDDKSTVDSEGWYNEAGCRWKMHAPIVRPVALPVSWGLGRGIWEPINANWEWKNGRLA
jgi:hypothetical protein